MKRKAKRISSNLHKLQKFAIKNAVRNGDGLGTSMPPSLASIEIYFDQKGLLDIARDFYDEHELLEWKNATGKPVMNWKVCATDWIYDHRQEMKRQLRKSPFYNGSF